MIPTKQLTSQHSRDQLLQPPAQQVHRPPGQQSISRSHAPPAGSKRNNTQRKRTKNEKKTVHRLLQRDDRAGSLDYYSDDFDEDSGVDEGWWLAELHQVRVGVFRMHLFK